MAAIKGQATPYDIDTYKRVNWLQYQYDRYDRYWKPEMERYVENARMFWGINYGQWPVAVVEALRNKGRNPPTFNFLLDKIETFVGSIMGNTFDIRFAPISGNYDAMALKLQDMYISDKINMDWDFSEMEAILDMAVAVGYERMTVSDKMHWLGNLAWEKLNPRHILLDPGWKSSDPYKLRSYFRWEKMSADEISLEFESKSEKLKELRARELVDGIDHGENGGIAAYKTMEEKWGSRHTVIEYHWIETKERYWEYDTKNNTPFPDCGYKLGSDEDRSLKIQYIQQAGLQPFDITFMKQKQITKYVQAACPTIDAEMLLITGPDRIQTGSVNLLPLGWKYEGQYSGLVDRQKDLQRSYNKGEMLIEDQQMTTAHGSKIIDESLAGSDPGYKAQIEQAANEPGAIAWAAAGSTRDLGQHGGIIPMNANPVTGDIFQQQQRRERNFDRFSKVPAAQESRSEYAGEPASMFKDKNSVAILGQRVYLKHVETNKKHKAEMYARQAKITYSGIERKFGETGTKKSISINKQGYDAKGLPVLLDDIRMLPEMKVTLVPAKDSVSLRESLRQDYGVLLQSVSADPRNRLLTISIVGAVLETTPLPEDKKEEFKKATELMKKDAALELAVMIKGRMDQLNPPAPTAPIQGALPPPGAVPEAPVEPQQETQAQPQEANISQGTTQQ